MATKFRNNYNLLVLVVDMINIKEQKEMKKLLLINLAIILVLISGVLFGCAEPEPAAPAPAAPAPTAPEPAAPEPAAPAAEEGPQRGGTLKIIQVPGITNLGVPDVPLATDMHVSNCCVETLFNMDKDGNVIPWLVTDYKYSPNYDSLTLNLRQGVKFHDGTNFDAQAVKYNLEMCLKGVFKAWIGNISSIDVVDDYTVRLNLSSYKPALIMNLASVQGRMLSPTAVEAKGKEYAYLHPVGTGSFKFVSYTTDVSVKFERFDDYWQKGKPYLDSIEWILIADKVSQSMALQAGEAQALLASDPKVVADLQATGKYSVNKCNVSCPGLAGDSINPESPFADIRVRQAVAYAINNEALAKAVGYGIFEATNQFSAPGHLSYNPAVVGYPHDPQKARELLTQLGYSKDKPLECDLSFREAGQATYTAVQGYLSEVGINAKLVPLSAGMWSDLQSKGWKGLAGYDLTVANGLDDADCIRGSMSSQRNFYPSIEIPAELDAALAASDAERDPQKRTEMIREMIKIITDKYCIAIPLYINYQAAVIKSPEVHDCDFSAIAGHIWHPADVWISK